MMCITLLASGFIIGACPQSITSGTDQAAWTLPAWACTLFMLDIMQCESNAKQALNCRPCP